MPLSNRDNVIRIADIRARITELTNKRDYFDSSKPVGPESNISDAEAAELDALESVVDQCGTSDGAMLRQTYFDQVTAEQAVELTSAARLASYKTVDFDGVPYLVPRA